MPSEGWPGASAGAGRGRRAVHRLSAGSPLAQEVLAALGAVILDLDGCSFSMLPPVRSAWF